MTSAAEYRRAVPADSEAILNALPNPVLLVAPDGRIIDANIAAESFFEISTQFLRRQSLKELVPFGSPLLALIDQVRASGSPVNEYKVDLGTPRRSARRAADRTSRPHRRDAAGAYHCRQDGPAIDPSQRGALGDRAGRDAGA